jgi:hypothetical protein
MNYKHILEKALFSLNKPNLLLYGYHKIDKYKILKNYLGFSESITNEIIHNDIKYHSNHKILSFDMNTIKRSKIENLFILLLEKIKHKNYYINENRIIILYNFNHIDKSIQDRFRVIFEKYRINTIFILITDYYNSVYNPIKSRFLSIRIRDLSNEDKISISYPIIKNLSYNKRIKIYDHIYKYSDKSIILNYCHNNYGLIKDYHDIIKTIYDSLKTMKTLDLSTVKDYAYSLEKYHLKNFHSEFLKIIIDDLKYDMISNIIFKITEIETKYKNSFNRILSNELLLIFIHSKINYYLSRSEEINRDKEE